MTISDLVNSILKQKKLFVFLIALSIVLCSIGLKFTESTTAEIIIKYICDTAEEGLTENGQKINPYEINSSLVVKNAVAALGLSNTNIEGIRRNITVTPIVPTSEEEKYASWIERFSDYENNEDGKKHTVYYSVKYSTSEGKDFAKRMLSAVINQYRMFYVQKYTYNNNITELPGETAMQYDYYETVDMLREKIKANIEYLSSVSSDDDYRSPHTGYSLMDLAAEYKSLSEQELSVAERMVIENGMTKDAQYLKNSLQNKAEEEQLDIELNDKKAETQRNLMTVYSEKNEQYLWDKNDGNENDDNENNESSQVRENVERDDYYAQVKSVYDTLMLDYVKYRTDSFNAGINKQRYENDINSFADGFSNEELQNELENRLRDTCDKYNDLYALTKSTIDDYNTYKSAKSIKCISGVVSHKPTSTVFYYTVSIILAIALGVAFSIILMYTSKKDNDYEQHKA